MLSFLLIQRYNDAFFMPVNFIMQSENVKARQEESTMKIRKYACIAISAGTIDDRLSGHAGSGYCGQQE